ncbi:unnamed protein product [Cylindrotheca closterium]|uniref:VWFA domain-containing protein n=1 Tax=Cylindrotheca closterium TaxID=2856 RepID=A0AAD2FL66_9STRA|nr:unnamed protein product [Cylindrotheca closterium]
MNPPPTAPMEHIVPLPPDYGNASAPLSSHSASHDKHSLFSDYQIQQLIKQGFTKGLCTALEDAKKVFALRIWIVDNSGSMQQPDGQRMVPNSKGNNNTIKMVPSSRWDEIVDCVEYHAKLAGLIEAPTRFRLLNNPGANVGPQQFSIAEEQGTSSSSSITREIGQATSIMRKAGPSGCTPLTSHILEIHTEVSKMAPTLRRQGQKVAIIIATDGLPTDERGYGGLNHNQEFVEALRMLEGLPVWVVVRLCTNDDAIVNFYNDLDGQLELSLEVLDDFCGEAQEVINHNPWLNYGLPLHRLREFGCHDRVFDILDERPFLKSDIRDFFALLFGRENFDGMADPLVDWDAFVQQIAHLLQTESYQYNPLTRRVSPWINVSRLNWIHGRTKCFPANNCIIS